MREKYENASIEIITFESEDIMTDSGTCTADTVCTVDCNTDTAVRG